MASLNFKNAAFAVAVGAATLTGGFATTKVAMADEPPITLQTDCQKYKPGIFGASAQCQKVKLELATRERERAARELQEAKKKDACLDVLLAAKKNYPDWWEKNKDAARSDLCGTAARAPGRSASAAACMDSVTNEINTYKASVGRPLTDIEKDKFRMKIAQCDVFTNYQR